MVPLQGFGMEYCYGDSREYSEGYGFLDNLQLHQAEWASIDATSDVICWNHETVL